MQQLVNLGKKYPNIAYLYAALSNIALALNQILIKQVTYYIAPSQSLYYRTIILVFLAFFLMRRDKKSPYISDPALFSTVLMRIGIIGGAAAAMYQCLKYLPHCISFIGVILMIQPEFIFGENSVHKGEYYYAFIGIMLFAAFANALNMHFVYLLAKKLDPAINIFYSYLGFLASSALLSVQYPSRLTNEKLDLTFFMLIFAIAGTGFFLQNLILMANSLKKPSLMMPFGYLGVVAGLLADLYIFENQFTFLTLIGVCLTSGGLLSGFLNQKEQKPPSVPQKSTEQIKSQQKEKQKENQLNNQLSKQNELKIG